MYGSKKDIKYNLTLFFIDGITFTPSMTLISIAAVIPYFLTQLNATTFQIALAASIVPLCVLVSQPFFGYIATHSKVMNKTFGKILLLQRLIFLIFVLCIPFLIKTGAMLVWLFLIFWGLFNIFVGSYAVFYTPILVKLLPPNKRGAIRGMGHAMGSFIGLASAAVIPVIISRFSFPYNYTLIFLIGLAFLIVNAFVFLSLRQHEDVIPNKPLNIAQYIKEMPLSIQESPLFRTTIFCSLFLVVANSLLPYYTLYAIRIFSITESHIATFAGLAVLSSAFSHIVFGLVVDRKGPKTTLVIAASLILLAGITALATNSLVFLFVAWIFANLGYTCYIMSASLLLGEICPPTKLPLYTSVHMIITLSVSSTVLLLLAPALDNIGFIALFIIILVCGIAALSIGLLILRSKVRNNSPMSQ